ncbi:hypothetical protein ASA1KI_31860 [Opitutales bacterium ASA1]|uniref:hypothetical protein n=1 Tax=Congregicoccus parvus TaxID=3081749 RepID=UPI002B2D8FF8|nr:hypothetical protein ASA1KI_31860 [Opitutales bacterium ASA1]
MNAAFPCKPEVTCEILAIKTLAPVLRGIVETCARDVGQRLAVRVLPVRSRQVACTITLEIPAPLVLEPHQVWCLACRVACFCPQARVSVLVKGMDAARNEDGTAADATAA